MQGSEPIGLVVGIDVGTTKCVIAYGPAASAAYVADLVPNEMSNLSTPSMCSFQGKQRFIGESATGLLGTNPKNTVPAIPRLLGLKPDDFQDPHAQFTVSADNGGGVVVEVAYKDAPLSLRPEHLLGMLLYRLVDLARNQVAGECVIQKCVIALPGPLYTAGVCKQVADAARIAGMPPPQVVPVHAASATCYNVKHEMKEEDAARTVMFVDIGSHYSSLCLYSQVKSLPPAPLCPPVLLNLGGEALVRRLWTCLAKDAEDKGAGPVKEGTRGGQRLLTECMKCVRTLSTVQVARVELECFGPHEKDLTLEISRDKFESLCAPEREVLKSSLLSVLEQSGVAPEDISQVELTGGATRTPWVRSLISSTVTDKLSYMLDSTSANAFGSVFLAQSLSVAKSNPEAPRAAVVTPPHVLDDVNCHVYMSEAEVESAIAMENAMQMEDAQQAQLSEARNNLEAYILEMRSACTRDEELALGASVLEAAEDWMYTEEGEGADLNLVHAKLAEVQSYMHNTFPSYFAHLAEERQKVEAELTAQAALAAEQAKHEEKDDHDTRKLAKPERMRLLKLNKDEGTELFKGKNLEAAILHWRKALAHAAKFFDLAPQDQEEVDDLKVALHLNIAMAYLKADVAEALSRVVTNCEEVLMLRPNNVKALFRRATALEKMKDYEGAKNDLMLAKPLEPDDTAITKLLERVEAQITRQVVKEKQMYGKMFG
mmetsp:Transcript_11122/g.15141  ORF Transcript_11122/g.15141 Transcript_11122/m.15141 type:complete len:714 (+) Transcript_11122:123-2264(+)|eukprot:CAMPEP_0196572326 /NCGR_PEP_ID=MMETSP1081-20130531/2395_1 /TAXON_ID=36882 /ORGANISM="Pyramimonas amylifera, Strain CCMP720" /LENGTH=713 /DNA_ID=CAMNT_0041889609 /DNA_START=123 /DNA_END=2264 /DNA_ORIENTATION=+